MPSEMPKDHPARAQHQVLLKSWITLVRNRDKRLAQRDHDDMADKWDRHREKHLEPQP